MDKESANDELREELEEAREKGFLILVEGKNDKKAFEELGFENVFAIDKMAHYRVVEEVAKRAKEAVIMTDLDKEGKKLYSYFNHHLCQNGVRVNNKLREFMFRETKLRQMEGLVSYLKRS